MGGVLSHSNARDSRRNTSGQQRQQHSNRRNTLQQADGKRALHQVLNESEKFQQSRNFSQPLYTKFLQHPLAANWNSMPANKEFILVTISKKSSEYKQVNKLFKSTTKQHYFVTEIKRVQNPFLLGCYLLKKLEMKVIYGTVKEELVFHGTKESCVSKICEDSFNWRMHGESAGNTYGQGVCFSPISYYASHYSCQDQEIKVMFVVRMLIHEAAVGSRNMILPPRKGKGNEHYDTAAKENGHVFVKFCDNEFYPEYLIYYKGSPDSKTKNKTFIMHIIYEYYMCIIALLLLAYLYGASSNVHDV